MQFLSCLLQFFFMALPTVLFHQMPGQLLLSNKRFSHQRFFSAVFKYISAYYLLHEKVIVEMALSLSVDLVNALLCSKDFADTLQRVGGKAESILYEGRTHTDIFLQVIERRVFLPFLLVPVDWQSNWIAKSFSGHSRVHIFSKLL